MLDKFERDEGIRHFQRGVALERLNRILEAVEEYRQAVANYPHLREAHAALGFYYQRNGLLAKAAEEFHIVASLEGGFLAYFNLGHVLVELERYEEALDAFQQCLGFAPDDPATHYEIAYIHYTCGDFAIALEHLYIPLHSYPEDWEVHNLMGKCYLGLCNYDESTATFRRALILAPSPQVEADLLDSMMAVERYREFPTLQSAKDSMYAQEGVVYLGSSQDDGLMIAEAQDYHFTYPDIGTTLQRLLALQQACGWRFTTVVSVDRLSHPIVGALAELMALPVRQFDTLAPEDVALMVMSVAREADLLLLMVERAACSCVTFCLGLNWLRYTHVLPDMTGMVVRGTCSVPWEPELSRLYADGASPEQIDTCIQSATTHIVHAVRYNVPDDNLAEQVSYYIRDHERLSFCALS